MTDSPFPFVSWVSQEDANGCAPATLAMLTGRTYREARDLIDGLWDRPKDWSKEGCSNYDIDRPLFAAGYFIQRRYSSWTEMGTVAQLPFAEPFAPAHYAMVEQETGNHHFVVMLRDGTVLDPMREGRYTLSDWPKVLQVTGVAAPLTQIYVDVAKAAGRFTRAEAEGHQAVTTDAHLWLLRAVSMLEHAA